MTEKWNYKDLEDLKKRLWSRMRNYTGDSKLLKRYMNDLNLIEKECKLKVLGLIDNRIKEINKVLKSLENELPDYPEEQQEQIDNSNQEEINKLIGEKEGLEQLSKEIGGIK